MHRFAPKLKKIFALILIVAIVAPSAFLMTPKKAEADIPVIDFTNTGREITDIIGQVVTMAVSLAFNQVVNGYLKDADLVLRNLENYVNEQAGKIIDSVDLDQFKLCSFNPGLNFELQIKHLKLEEWGADFPNLTVCSIADIFVNGAQDFDTFYQKSFSVGGWGAFYATTQDITQNPFGATLIVEAETARKVAAQKERDKEELAWGDGFKSEKKDDKIKNPGKVINAQTANSQDVTNKKLASADEVTDAIVTALGAILAQYITNGIPF